MLPSPRFADHPTALLGELPCNACLLDTAEGSGMAGAAACPLKTAFLQRLAASRQGRAGAVAASCAAFEPGFADDLDGGATVAADRSRRPN
jgi:hypothetical protein